MLFFTIFFRVRVLLIIKLVQLTFTCKMFGHDGDHSIWLMYLGNVKSREILEHQYRYQQPWCSWIGTFLLLLSAFWCYVLGSALIFWFSLLYFRTMKGCGHLSALWLYVEFPGRFSNKAGSSYHIILLPILLFELI